jgi:hypothetical protein
MIAGPLLLAGYRHPLRVNLSRVWNSTSWWGGILTPKIPIGSTRNVQTKYCHQKPPATSRVHIEFFMISKLDIPLCYCTMSSSVVDLWGLPRNLLSHIAAEALPRPASYSCLRSGFVARVVHCRIYK